MSKVSKSTMARILRAEQIVGKQFPLGGIASRSEFARTECPVEGYAMHRTAIRTVKQELSAEYWFVVSNKPHLVLYAFAFGKRPNAEHAKAEASKVGLETFIVRGAADWTNQNDPRAIAT